MVLQVLQGRLHEDAGSSAKDTAASPRAEPGRNSVYLLLRGLWKFRAPPPPHLKLAWKDLECPKLLSPPCFLPSLLTLPPKQTPPSLVHHCTPGTQSSCPGKTASWTSRKNLQVYPPEQGTGDVGLGQHTGCFRSAPTSTPTPPGAPYWASPRLPVLLPPSLPPCA